MYDEQQATEQHGPLAGFTVGVTAARRADELGALLQRRGAAVLHAPALRIVPLSDDSELLAATKDLIDQAPDVVIATTAIGFRGWVEAADGWGLGEAHGFNKGMMASRGRYVKVLTDDDYFYPDAMRQAITIMEQHPELEIGRASCRERV